MEDAENRLSTEPAPIGSDRLEGQKCKYAEKSYMYKYDLGHTFLVVVVDYCKVLVQSVREREGERSLPPRCNCRVWRVKRTRGRCLCVSSALYSSHIVLFSAACGCRGFSHIWVFHVNIWCLISLCICIFLYLISCILLRFGCGRTNQWINSHQSGIRARFFGGRNG